MPGPMGLWRPLRKLLLLGVLAKACIWFGLGGEGLSPIRGISGNSGIPAPRNLPGLDPGRYWHKCHRRLCLWQAAGCWLSNGAA
ncbi:hypothetical protein GGR50DRAFT_645226 [Xylaria sp. CBS 124048]|nr:hypothetical protein GGR50DRAFT_645226 [Xylaria sp. CBS 124048]